MTKNRTPAPPISANETWKDQYDIKRLIQKPNNPVKPDQIYVFNNKYGFGQCIKNYAGMSEYDSLPGIVPHGTTTYGRLSEKATAPKQELIKKIPCIFASSTRCLQGFINSGKQYVFPIGLASTYAFACLEEKTINSQGSLFFRTHSTQGLIGEINDKDVIRWLQNLPKRFYPIRVSVFPFDLTRGAYKPYEDAGFQLVSAGAEFDKYFIWRHLHLIRSHKHILSTGMGTHIFHSIMCGKPVLIRQFKESHRLINRHFKFDTKQITEFQELSSIFGTETSEPTNIQIQLTKQFLGTMHTLPPTALRRVIDLARDIHVTNTRLSSRARS